MIKEVFLTTLTGMGVAPPVFAGLMGIFGLWMGYGLVQRFLS
jgi:xanthosine utilization system XapX-like protein